MSAVVSTVFFFPKHGNVSQSFESVKQEKGEKTPKTASDARETSRIQEEGKVWFVTDVSNTNKL